MTNSGLSTAINLFAFLKIFEAGLVEKVSNRRNARKQIKIKIILVTSICTTKCLLSGELVGKDVGESVSQDEGETVSNRHSSFT